MSDTCVRLKTRSVGQKWVASKGRLTASSKNEVTAVRLMATKWFGLCLMKRHGFELVIEHLRPGLFRASLRGAK